MYSKAGVHGGRPFRCAGSWLAARTGDRDLDPPLRKGNWTGALPVRWTPLLKRREPDVAVGVGVAIQVDGTVGDYEIEQASAEAGDKRGVRTFATMQQDVLSDRRVR